MITSKKLSNYKGINHGFFNRSGGMSKGIYKSLNCGIGSKDKKGNVYKNLDVVKKKICRKNTKIFLPYQIHSNKIYFIDNKFKINKKINADAVITDQKKIPIAILTADCVPILIYDCKKNMVAAIHAGWKGAYKGIIQKVIYFMLNKGCNKKNILASIGPCISPKSYNVKSDFKKKFLKKDKKNKVFFKKRKGTIYFDLPGYVKFQLKLMKIINIDMINIDTFDAKNNFFSARRAMSLNHGDYGRNISIIMIN